MKQQKIKTQMKNLIIIGDKQIMFTRCVIQHKVKIIAISYDCTLTVGARSEIHTLGKLGIDKTLIKCNCRDE
jgi:hypothetical protein